MLCNSFIGPTEQLPFTFWLSYEKPKIVISVWADPSTQSYGTFHDSAIAPEDRDAESDAARSAAMLNVVTESSLTATPHTPPASHLYRVKPSVQHAVVDHSYLQEPLTPSSSGAFFATNSDWTCALLSKEFRSEAGIIGTPAENPLC